MRLLTVGKPGSSTPPPEGSDSVESLSTSIPPTPAPCLSKRATKLPQTD